ncbi:two-component sensor histidine kinase [Hydrococcus rivularis NIES-593]|uniref:Circadian input-output histidine kinase CikA n=1 Tax=Hydrococcus rivularis NIES-593 TaxID=1921803 RepID=A0A1U7H9M5_9CYAN|nr:sensor histidine kinase [Hydrococcus rivularis]OKH20286.1 two-component sensor histidine kinase [Hydrococcus rivularis NIES-593]
MALGQSSFRRILLSRLLLVSVPVLLVGVYVTYRKARSAFLETARQNLTESAVRKGESIDRSIEALRANLATASDSVVFKQGTPIQQQAFLDRLASKLPNQIQCVQLTNFQTGQVIASTCGNQPLDNPARSQGAVGQESLAVEANKISIKFLLPQQQTSSEKNEGQLELLLSAPVYDDRDRPRYVLSFKSALQEKEFVSTETQPGSLTGYTVVINQQGTILAHPLSERVGRNIREEDDANRLKDLVWSAIAGQPKFLHLFAFDEDGVELVAGYSAIASPITSERAKKWVILAVAPIDKALAPLQDIQKALFGMTLALIVASILVILYISRELARPLEQLRDYAIKKELFCKKTEAPQTCPQNFKIREFNQLASAIQEMLERLQTWGDEIVCSWREAQNANQLKNEFLATTSHELRTPLNGIINCIRIIKEGYCDSREEEIEFLQQADNAAIHLLNIINDILDIAKIEAGKLSVNLESVDLGKLLKEVINLQIASIQKKGLKLKTPHWENDIIIYTDPAKLRQVLLNVIGNAVKFTQSGSIAISIGIEKDEAPVANASKVVITVKDTGIGIDPSQQDKLFHPFVMVDGSTTRQFGGTGLGLAISRNLIELMGGSIKLHSAGCGKGTTVKIGIPLTPISPIREVSRQQTENGSQKLLASHCELPPANLASSKELTCSQK